MITTILALAALQSAFDGGRTLPLAMGEWRYTRDSLGSSARFGDQFQLRCDRASRSVTLVRLMPAPPSVTTSMTIVTDTRTMSYPSRSTSLGAFDSALDAIAFSRGRWIVRLTGGGAGEVALPAAPEIARSIEDCRN